MTSQEFLNDAHRQGNLRDMHEAMKSEDAAIGDTVGALSIKDNFNKAEAVLQVLNAFNTAKLNLTGTCQWTIHDLRAWGFAVRALGTSWELTVQAQEALKGNRRRADA